MTIPETAPVVLIIKNRIMSKYITCYYVLGKDVLRTDRDQPLFSDPDSPKLVQLEDILKTYVMYNFDLGTWSEYTM